MTEVDRKTEIRNDEMILSRGIIISQNHKVKNVTGVVIRSMRKQKIVQRLDCHADHAKRSDTMQKCAEIEQTKEKLV